MTTIKKWKKDEIRAKLETNDVWLFKGLVAIFNKQTADEQDSGVTCHENGMGFTGADAEFMTSLANQYLVCGSLSKRQTEVVRKRMLKYAGQLAKIANAKAKEANTLL